MMYPFSLNFLGLYHYMDFLRYTTINGIFVAHVINLIIYAFYANDCISQPNTEHHF